MAAIDYEAEYNLRARVPEHPEIFARWARDAEDYRVETLKRDRAELGLSYGDTPRQTLDLFLPEAREAAPLGIFFRRPARDVRPWRLLALARSIVFQPHGARPQRPRHRRRGGGL
jgi:hypothetical protein